MERRTISAALAAAFVAGFFSLLAAHGVASQPAVGVSQGSLDYYQRQYEVSRGEAGRRLELQGHAVELNEHLIKSSSSELAAVWFDNERGEIVVGIRSRDGLPVVRDALRAEGVTADSRIVILGYDREQLTSDLATLTRKFHRKMTDGRVSFAIRDGRVSADIARSDTALADQVESLPGTTIRTRFVDDDQLSPEPLQCNRYFCDDLVGGNFWWPTHDPAAMCSTAFAGSYIGYRVLFTAGHCVTYRQENPALPVFPWDSCDVTAPFDCSARGIVLEGQFAFGADGDYGMLLAGGTYPVVDGIVDRTTVPYAIRPVPGYIPVDPPTGITLCKHGATTGTSCGTLWAVDSAVVYPTTIVRHVMAIRNMCAGPGDSGAGITFDLFGNLAAVGILSGSSNPPVCSNVQVYATPLHRALAGLGATFP